MNAVTTVSLALVLIATVAAEPGQFVPRAFYTIDEFGKASPLVYLNPSALLRVRRSSSGSFSSSSSSASSSSSSGSGGSGGAPIYFGGDFGGTAPRSYYPSQPGYNSGYNNADYNDARFNGGGYNSGYSNPGYNNGGYDLRSSNPGYGSGYNPGYNAPSGGSQTFAGASSSSSSGSGVGGPGVIQTRFAGDDSGPGVGVSGSANIGGGGGTKGVFSSSSTAVDPDGQVHYSVKSGKF